MKNNNSGFKETSITRRKFIRDAACGTLGFTAAFGSGKLIETVYGESDSSLNNFTGKSKVVSVKSFGVIKEKSLNSASVEIMVNEGIKKLTNKTDVAEAWGQFVSKDDVVGLKINPIGMKRLSTKPEIVDVIIKGLQSVGVKPNNIIVWDRFEKHMKMAGYPFNTSSNGVRYFSSEPTGGYDKENYYQSDNDKSDKRDKNGNISYFSNILTKEITSLINIPVMKDHSIAGVTLCLKNIAYGVVNNTRRFHPAPYFCDPMTAEVCSHPAVTKKLKLHILDCLQACYHGGPVNIKPFDMWNEERIMFSADPVAIDHLGMEIIEKKRRENNKPTILERATKQIKTAAKMGLGTNDRKRIDLIEMEV